MAGLVLFWTFYWAILYVTLAEEILLEFSVAAADFFTVLEGPQGNNKTVPLRHESVVLGRFA